MNTLLIVAAIACGIIGLLGAIIPVLPGTLLSLAGLILAYFTDGSEITVNMLIIWSIISVFVVILDYILPGYFSKRFGGTKSGITGATVGVILGMFFGPVGIIFGPFIGAVAGELLGNNLSFDKAIVVGFGSLLSFFVGTGFKLIVGCLLLFYIIKDII